MIETYDPSAPWLTRFLRGVVAPFRGLRTLAATPALWAYVAVPILITTVLMALALYATLTLAPPLAGTLHRLADTPTLLQVFVHNLLVAALYVMVFVASAMAAWFGGLLLASPFYDRLSDTIEQQHGAIAPVVPPTLERIAGDVSIGVLHSLANLALYLSLACPLACVGLVPFVGEVLGMIGGTLLSSGLVALEVLDFSLSRRRYGWWQKIRWLWQHRATLLGLGFGAWLLLLIPLGAFVATPAAVIAATELFVAMQRADALPK